MEIKQEKWLSIEVNKRKIVFTRLLSYMRYVEKHNLEGVVVKDKKSKEFILDIKKDYEGKK